MRNKFGLLDADMDAIVSILDKYPKVDKAFLFGSRAKGNFKNGSDIDLALKGNELNFDTISQISYQLNEETKMPYKFDVLNYHSIKEPDLKDHIDPVGIELYSRWKECKLGDISLYVNRGISPSYVESEGIQILNQKCIRNGRIDFSQAKQTFAEKKYTIEKRLLKNDLLINSTGVGTAGRVSRFLSNELCYVDTHVSIVRIDKKLADPNYVFYNLNSREDEIESYAEGSTGQIELGRERIKAIDIILPPIPEQTAIASILSSLDDKIDLLHRQNKTLEQLAETLFRQWFVEEAEESWDVGTLDDVASFHNGKSRPNEGGKTPIYGGNGILGYTNVFNYSGKSIIVGRVGAYCGSLYFENNEIWVSDNALLVKAKKDNQIHYLFYLLKSLELNSMAQGSSHPLLTQTLLKSIEIVKHPKFKIENFDFLVEQWNKKIEFNNNQIRTLTRTRDTLLPKLMSGEVRISD